MKSSALVLCPSSGTCFSSFETKTSLDVKSNLFAACVTYIVILFLLEGDMYLILKSTKNLTFLAGREDNQNFQVGT